MVAGCGGSSVPMRKVLETEHFEVWRENGLPDACVALGEWLEGYYSSFERYLEVQRPTTRKITYKQYDHIQAAFDACGGFGSNCYLSGSETSGSVGSRYTRTRWHMYSRPSSAEGADTPAFFSKKGTASALGGGFGTDRDDGRRRRVGPNRGPGSTTTAFWKYVSDNGPEGGLFERRRGFVRYLIETHGKATFLAFYAALDGVKGENANRTDLHHRPKRAAALAGDADPGAPGPSQSSTTCCWCPPAVGLPPLGGARRAWTSMPSASRVASLLSMADASGRADVVLQSAGAFIESCGRCKARQRAGPGLKLVPKVAEVRVALGRVHTGQVNEGDRARRRGDDSHPGRADHVGCGRHLPAGEGSGADWGAARIGDRRRPPMVGDHRAVGRL